MEQTRISIMDAWPTTLFLCDWPEHATRATPLIEHLQERAAGFARPVQSRVGISAKPAEGLVESPLDLFRSSEDENLQALAAWCRACVAAAVSRVNGDKLPPEQLQVEFNESWFHITNRGGFHDAHMHGNCSWCGIFYLASGDAAEVPEGGAESAGNGINRFYAPIGVGGVVRDYGNAYLGTRCYFDVQPLDGRLVIFPAYLLHSALPYTGTADRVIISFNSVTRRRPRAGTA